MSFPVNVRAAAQWYVDHGYWIVQIELRQKGPTIDRWQDLRLKTADLDQYFGNGPCNIGLLLGEPYNLCDVDSDCREVMWSWQEFAIETNMIWGRHSKPASHHLYYSDPALRSIKLKDPTVKDDSKACMIELRTYKKDGSVGMQTMCPPSIHPSGERVEFVRNGDPANVDGPVLERAVYLTGATALLGRHAPGEGSRHDFFLAIAGALAHAKWDLTDACKVVRAIYHVLWGPKADLYKAEREVESTFQRYDDGGETTGIPHLKEMLDEKVLNKALEWLGLDKPKSERPRTRSKDRTAPPVYSADQVIDMAIAPPEQLIEELLPRTGASLVYGVQKSGKTIFAMQAAIAVATGKPLFDNYRILAPGGALILEQDDPAGAASVQQILVRAGVPRGTPLYFVPKQDCFYIGPEMIEWLEKRITEQHLTVVVLDSYTALRGSRPAGVDVVKHENHEITILDELGKRTGCLIILLHHDSKSSAALDWTSKAGGSYAMTMATESQIYISRYPDLAIDARERLVRLQGRHLSSKELTLSFRVETMNFDLLLEGAGASLYPLILEIQMEFADQPFNAKLLGAATGMSRSVVFRHMATLRRIGILIKSKNSSGDYCLDLTLARRMRGETN